MDPRRLTFSQAQGLEELPHLLALAEMPPEVRNRIWDVFYRTMMEFSATPPTCPYPVVFGNWEQLLRDLHARFFIAPADEFSDLVPDICDRYKSFFLGETPYNKVFDLLQHMMRHPRCPTQLVSGIETVFEECHMACVVDTDGAPTIFSAATHQEGEAIHAARHDLKRTGLDAANDHLQRAAELLNDGKWRESVHESISAVESVATSLGTQEKTLGTVLKKLEKQSNWQLHPAFLAALSKLYGYTSDEQGVRHAATESDTHVDREEAQFMIGTCASFCSYLLGKKRQASKMSGNRSK